MSVPLSTALSVARAYLNDTNATQFPDPVLIPLMQEAHRELQEELWSAGSPVVRAQSSVLAYTSGSTTFPTLPTDLLCPTKIFENAVSSVLTSAGWTPMTEVFYLPLGQAQQATLGYWCWQQEAIQIIGASANRTAVVQYRCNITIPQLSTDLIGILYGESYMGARGAAMAAGTLGNADLYASLASMAKENLAKVISNNRGQQKPLLKP